MDENMNHAKFTLWVILIITLGQGSVTRANEQSHTITIGVPSYQELDTSEMFNINEIEDKLVNQIGYRYRLTEHLSVGGQWTATGSSKLSSTADSRGAGFDFSSLAITINGRYPLVKNLFIDGFAGIANSKTSYDGFDLIDGDILISDKKHASATKATYGLGLVYQFDNFEIGLLRQNLAIKNFDLRLTSLSIGYRF